MVFCNVRGDRYNPSLGSFWAVWAALGNLGSYGQINWAARTLRTHMIQCTSFEQLSHPACSYRVLVPLGVPSPELSPMDIRCSKRIWFLHLPFSKESSTIFPHRCIAFPINCSRGRRLDFSYVPVYKSCLETHAGRFRRLFEQRFRSWLCMASQN